MSETVSRLRSLRKNDRKAEQAKKLSENRSRCLKIEEELSPFAHAPDLRIRESQRVDELLQEHKNLQSEIRVQDNWAAVGRALKTYFWTFFLLCTVLIVVCLYLIWFEI